jgi:exonuclease III
LNNKLPELGSLLHSSQFDVLCITETWFHSSTADCALVNGSNCSIYRSGRTTSQRARGVSIVTNNSSIKAIDVPLPPQFSHLELQVLHLLRDAKLRLFGCYQSPSHNTDLNTIQCLKDLCICVSSLIPSKGSIILCGDFNLPDIVWSVDNSLNNLRAACSSIFLDFCYSFDQHQSVQGPTRGDNTFDLVLANDCKRVLNVKIF